MKPFISQHSDVASMSLTLQQQEHDSTVDVKPTLCEHSTILDKCSAADICKAKERVTKCLNKKENFSIECVSEGHRSIGCQVSSE